MLPTLVTLLFIVSVLTTSALAYDEKRWRYAFLGAAVCAGMLTVLGARGLRAMFRSIDLELTPLAAVLATALPLGLILASLIMRRRNTPRHTPSINDDPTLRRHVEEKTRRARKRRQEDEAVENSDVPSL
jgi:hypothetical protein